MKMEKDLLGFYMTEEVICEYKNICDNYLKECSKCSFNKKLEFRNYLKIEQGTKTIRYLENSDE